MTQDSKKKKTSPDYSLIGREALKLSGDAGASKPEAGLYVIATPIGNLGDITLRALMTLAGVDAVYCEDTRVTGGLLNRYGIAKPLIACHDHNEASRVDEVLARLSGGEALALVSDAGTPLLSDPGFRIVAACRAAGHKVEAVPGASALLTALAGSGLPTDKVLFGGFLPPKETGRRRVLESFTDLRATLVFYEAPQRLADSLRDMDAVLGNRAALVARELTKLFEEMRSGSLAELAAFYAANEARGECVVLIGPPDDATPADLEEIIEKALDVLLPTMRVKEAVVQVAKETGAPRRAVYAKALKMAEKT
jgi:16S rRNA (cytidine1402-2'-O)-methyltransferase